MVNQVAVRIGTSSSIKEEYILIQEKKGDLYNLNTWFLINCKHMPNNYSIEDMI